VPSNVTYQAYIRIYAPTLELGPERGLQQRPKNAASLIAAAVSADQYCGFRNVFRLW
jgi:hypothetical protein